jgi:hypothetical protein
MPIRQYLRQKRRFQNKREPPLMDPALRELIALSLLAGGGCALALAQGEFLFVAVLGAACAAIIIEAMRRWGER